MTTVYLLLALAAALGFYLASAHQRFCPAARAHAHGVRLAAWVASALAIAAAMGALGPSAGMFAALTTLMLAMVLLPPLDAWRQFRQERDHGG